MATSADTTIGKLPTREPIGTTRSLSPSEALDLSTLGKPRGEIASLTPDELARDAKLVREMTKLLYD